MKIKVLLNRIQVDLTDDFEKAKDYFYRHGLPIEFEFVETDIKGYKVTTENFGSVGFRKQISGHEKLIPLSRDYITVFAFNGNEYPLAEIPTSKCQIFPNGVLITLMTYKEGDAVGENYKTFIHEMMHALNQQLRLKGIFLEDPMDIMFRNGQWLQYYKNDSPDAPDSNFSEAWKILTPYLSKLNPMKYKYFSEKEIVGLKPEFVEILDKAREIAGTPFIINSGFRTPEHNKKVGGVANSAHLRGMAVDLHCAEKDHVKRCKILWGLMQFRDKLFIEICRKHIHIDCDGTIHALGSVMWANDD